MVRASRVHRDFRCNALCYARHTRARFLAPGLASLPCGRLLRTRASHRRSRQKTKKNNAKEKAQLADMNEKQNEAYWTEWDD